MFCQPLSSLGPFPDSLLLVSTSPLLAHWTLLHPSMSPTPLSVPGATALPPPSLACPEHCAEDQGLPLAQFTPFSMQQPLPLFTSFHTELILFPFKPCAFLHCHSLAQAGTTPFSPGSPLGHSSPLLWNPVTLWSWPIAFSSSIKYPSAFVEQPCVPVRGVCSPTEMLGSASTVFLPL